MPVSQGLVSVVTRASSAVAGYVVLALYVLVLVLTRILLMMLRQRLVLATQIILIIVSQRSVTVILGPLVVVQLVRLGIALPELVNHAVVCVLQEVIALLADKHVMLARSVA